MKHLRILVLAALVGFTLTACDDDGGTKTITGTITGTVAVEGAGLANVSVSLVGSAPGVQPVTTTGSDGSFTFASVPEGSYAVTISDIPAGVSFSNTAKTATITSDGSVATVDFNGSYIRTASVSGFVSAGGVGIPGVAINVTGPEGTDNAVTNDAGGYSVSGLRAGEYTVAMVPPAGYDFTVISLELSVGVGEAKQASFFGEPVDVPVDHATISIQSITEGGNPIDVSGVSGQIEVTVNINRGDLPLDKVQVLIGSKVVASQVFAAGGQGAAPELQSEVVTLNVPTNQVRAGSGGAKVPVIYNGQNSISAMLYEVGAEAAIPTNEVPVVMSNPDLLFAGDWTYAHEDGVDCAFNPDVEDGPEWCTGGTVLSGFEWISFGTVTPEDAWFEYDGSAECDDAVGSFTGDPDTGLVLTNTWVCDETEGSIYPDLYPEGFVLHADYGDAEGPDGSALTGPTNFSRLGAQFTLGGETRWFVVSNAPTFEFETLYVDNKGPSVSLLPVAFNDEFTESWVNGSYNFPEEDVVSSDGGVGVFGEKTYEFIPIDDTEDDNYPGICNTSMEYVTPDQSDMAETLTSDMDHGYILCGYAEDWLGNGGFSTWFDANANGTMDVDEDVPYSNYFGVDRTAPRAQIWGDNQDLGFTDPGVYAPYGDACPTPDDDPAGTCTPVSADMNTTIYGGGGVGAFEYDYADLAVMEWGFDAIDDRAGLEETVDDFPVIQNFTLTNPYTVENVETGFATCTGEWSIAGGTLAGNNWRRVDTGTDFLCGGDWIGDEGAVVTPGTDGIYTYEGYVVDRAGNESTHFTFNWLVDPEVPSSGMMALAQLKYAPGQTGLFDVYEVMDNLEVMMAQIWLQYPTTAGNINLLSSTTALATDRWDAAFYEADDPMQLASGNIFGRMDFTNGDGTLPGTWNVGADDYSMLPTAAAAFVSEDAGLNEAAAESSIAFIPGVVGWSGTTAAPWDDAGIDAFTIAFNEADSTFTVEHVAPTSQVEPFFDSVLLVSNDGGAVRVCGSTTSYATDDNGVNRFYTYTLDLPAVGACGTNGVDPMNFHAVGVSGNALLVTGGFETFPPLPPPAP